MGNLKISKEDIKGFQPLPEGIYNVRFEGFKPKTSKGGDSINLNPSFKVVDGPHAGRLVFGFINTKAGWILLDFSHCFGVPLQENADGSFQIPGELVPDNAPVEQQQYRGPLQGKTGKLMLTVGSYNGKPNNEIKYYVCGVPECNTKFPEISHSTNLL